jgi:hypothetical protein
MAIANSDGSIVLSTQVDTSGINKGMSQLTKTVSTLGKVIGSAFAIRKIIQFSNESASLATQTEASVQRLVDIYGEASGAVGDFIDANARALGMSKAAAASFSSVYGNLFGAWADQTTNAELTNRYLNMTAVVASKTGRTVEDVQERVRSGLLGNTEAIEDLGIFVNVKTIEMTDAFQRMADGKSWEQLDAYTQQQIRSMAILEQATAKYGDEVANTSATIRNRYKAAYEDFQNSWGNIVNTVLLPVLETLTQVFDIATKGLNVLSGVSGEILENVQIEEETADNTAENIKQQVKNQKDLNKEIKKTLAGFDDIQILSANTTKSTQSPPNLDVLGGGGTPDGSAYAAEINNTLIEIMGIVSIALMALGCILLFTGNISYGIGFIIAGAATFGITAATLGDDSIATETRNALSNVLILAGIFAIVIGIMLCMFQQWGIGIGLIAIGVASIVTPIAANWDGIKEQLQGSFGGWLALGGVIAIVLGILLCFTVFLPVGIGLIVLGVGALVAPVVANWDAISSKITETFRAVMDWIKTYGLLVLGILLCLSGVAIPFGIALIIMWAKKSSERGVPLATTIVDKVKEIGKAIGDIFDGVWEGIKLGFKGMVNGIIVLANLWIDGLNAILTPIRGIVYGVAKAFGNKISFEDVKIPHIPKLAQGAVLPANKPFLAMVGDQKHGTNIEAPLSTIEEAVENVISRRGMGGGVTREEHYYLNENELMSIIYKLAKKGEQAQGTDLIESW